MIYGAILGRGEYYYTDLSKIFKAIDNKQNEYNWLISGFEGYPHTESVEKMLSQEYCWLSGNELTDIVEVDNFQWFFAVLSGFKKDIPLAQVLEYPLPYADGYEGFWYNPVSIQHPLASVEIVPYDTTLVLVISRQKEFTDLFMKAFPLSEDLSSYITRKEKERL